MRLPLIVRIRSPGCRPAWSAGLSGTTSRTHPYIFGITLVSFLEWVTNDKSNDDYQDYQSECPKYKIRVFTSKFDVCARSFRYYCLFHFLLLLLAFINALLSPVTYSIGRTCAIRTSTHMLHAPAHLPVITLSLLLCW